MKKILGDASKAKRVKMTMSADQVAGDIVVENGLVGVLIDDTLDTVEGVAYIETDELGAGPFDLAAVDVDRYDVAYWDAGNAVFTNVASTNIRVGYFPVTAGSSDGTVTAVVFDSQLV